MKRRDVLVAVVGDGRFAMDILRVKEVIRPLAIAPVPAAPSFVEGIVELRGAVMPVVDLRRRFGATIAPLSRASRFVILGVRGRVVAAIVDRVAGVFHLDAEDIRAPDTVGPLSLSGLVTGVTTLDGGICLIVDPDELLTAGENRAISEMETG